MTAQTKTKTRSKERICWKCGRTFHDGRESCPDDGSRLLDLNPDDLDDPFIGTLFDGRFRIIKKLGEGGMGSVYAARQMDFERDVALKILKSDYLRNENIRKRFMYEARTISNLRHPNALRLFDFGQAPNAFYMVMELLEGESLADRLAYRFLPYREILNIVPPICDVLDEAHRNDVIHRDLKPENIYLVEVTGREEFAKLLDFGIAKHLTDETMTQSGTLWGTPAYMSPEQAKGETVGAPADVYAIGIILYELICGNLPFHSSTQMGLAMKHINVPSRPLSSIPGLRSVPPELDALIMQALAKDPDERPQSMAEFADKLIDIRERLFDDALLNMVPAEEVDAIALQQWIADEPAVDEEIPGIQFGNALIGTDTLDPGPEASVITRDVTPVDAASFSTEFRVPTKRPWILAGIGGVLFLAGVVGAVLYAWLAEETEPLATGRPTIVQEIDPSDPMARSAADAASLGGATLSNAQEIARRLRPDYEMMVVDSPEMIGRDGRVKRTPRTRPTKKKAPTEERRVKSALEGTF